MLSPIVLFVYNRPWHTAQTLAALAENALADQSVLYVFADGPRPGASDEELENIRKTRQLISECKAFKEVIVSAAEANIGVADSIIAGITKVVNEHGKIIVLEDDMLTGKGFLSYMNEALSLYENEAQVVCVHAFNFPIKTRKLQDTFFLKGADCWGWGTWKRGWDLFNPDVDELINEIKSRGLIHSFNQEGAYNFYNLLELQRDGEIDAWDIRFHASAFLKDKLTLYPKLSLVQNIGLDGSGMHCGINKENWPYTDYCRVESIEIKESRLALKYIKEFHSMPFKKRVLNKLRRIFHV